MFDIATFYDHAISDGLKEHAEQFSSLATLCQYRLPYEICLKYHKSGSQVLDWGCGNGHFSYFLLEQGAAVTAFSFADPPPYLVGRHGFAHKRGSAEEPRALPFESESFDCVYSMGVLEHVYESGGDEASSLSEIERILKPGGYFLCFHFPNRFGWIEPVGGLLRVNEHFHHRKYVTDDIRDLLSARKLELLEVGRYNFLPRNQLARLPKFWKDRDVGVKLLNLVDLALSKTMPVLNQNYYFVARKL